MYIERLEFENLRTFEHAEIEWNYPGHALGPVEFDNVNLLLGDNASGKTTVLKAVALGTLAPIFGSSSGFVPYFLVRRSSGTSGDASVTSSVLIEQDDADGNESGSECTLVLGRNRGGDTDRVLAVDEEAEDSTFRLSDALWEAERSGYFVVGYGANRRVEPESVAFNEESRSKSRFIRYQRVAGLFEESVTLVPLTAWLPLLRERDSKRYKQVKDLLRSLLEPHADVADIPNSREVLIRMNRGAVPSSALSDGYRAFLGHRALSPEEPSRALANARSSLGASRNRLRPANQKW